MATRRRITLVETEDGWTAVDEDTGMECSGEDRCSVLDRLDDAVSVSFDGSAGAGDAADDPDIDWFED